MTGGIMVCSSQALVALACGELAGPRSVRHVAARVFTIITAGAAPDKSRLATFDVLTVRARAALGRYRLRLLGHFTTVLDVFVLPSRNANVAANRNPPRGQRLGRPIPRGRNAMVLPFACS